MRRPEPRLQRKLLAWVLGPLLLLLVLDAGAAYWNAVRYSNQAYDRALQEIAREIALHVHAGEGGLRLDLSEAAARALLLDPEDRLFFRVQGADGAVLGGDAALPPPPQELGDAPRFYGAAVADEPVRMVAARLPLVDAPGAPGVLVQVAETLRKRERLAWEMVANVVLPELLLIAITALVVWFGVSRGLQPLQRLRRAV